MSDIVNVRNIGSYLSPVIAFYPQTFNSSATAKNNVKQTGLTIDRLATQGLYGSMDIAVLVRSSNSSKAKVTVTAFVEDSADASTWAAYGSASKSPFTCGATVGVTKAANSVNVAGSIPVDLLNARRYVRVDLLSNQSTNVNGKVTIAAAAVLGGANFNK